MDGASASRNEGRFTKTVVAADEEELRRMVEWETLPSQRNILIRRPNKAAGMGGRNETWKRIPSMGLSRQFDDVSHPLTGLMDVVGSSDKNKIPESLIGKHENDYEELETSVSSDSEEQYDNNSPASTRGERIHCTKCGELFPLNTYLLQERTPTEEKLFPRSEWDKPFNIIFSLDLHGEPQSEERPFASSECDKCFFTRQIRQRCEKIHTGEELSAWTEFDDEFTNKPQLEAHSGACAKGKPFSSPDGGKRCSLLASLWNYGTMDSGEERYEFSENRNCATVKPDLVVHQRTHTGEELYQHAGCGKGFQSQVEVFSAPKKAHTGAKTHECPECGINFLKRSMLTRHGKFHTGEKPFACPECGSCFRRNSTLKQHMLVHIQVRPFQCSECGKCFPRKGYLKVHMHFHNGERPFTCAECGKAFCSNSKFIVHQRTHTGEKPFSCSECGKTFTSKQLLDIHKSRHTGDRPYVCFECSRSFFRKWDLERHIKIHTGKNHTNPLCANGVLRLDHILKHT